jgi:hypothetical protein
LGQVLVLNATYEPLSVVTVKRAVVLLLKEKAELIEAAEARLRAESFSIPMPLVIRLVYYVLSWCATAPKFDDGSRPASLSGRQDNLGKCGDCLSEMQRT